MAFIGDEQRAAPRLSEVDLEPPVARRVWDELVDELAVLVSADRVHGGFSAFNVLWWRERAVLIDFSQTVEIVTHPAAHELLVRDIAALGRYFTRRGVTVHVDRILKRIGADAHRSASQQLRAPTRETRGIVSAHARQKDHGEEDRREGDPQDHEEAPRSRRGARTRGDAERDRDRRR